MAKLTTGQAEALRDLGRLSGGGTYLAPPRLRRLVFHQLIDLGLAEWGGYGLGGESFAITPAGRAVLKENNDAQ